MADLHRLNIIGYVALGTLALLVGLVPLLTTAKGGAAHRPLVSGARGGDADDGGAGLGRLQLPAVSHRDCAAEHIPSVFRLPGAAPPRHRAYAPRLGIFGRFPGGRAFLVLLPQIRLGWAPGIVYGTLGFLLATTAYDLSRFAWRERWRHGAWLYEHIWKLVSTYAALLAAFSGTVLVAYQPYSQFMPSVPGTAVAGGSILRAYRQRQRFTS